MKKEKAVAIVSGGIDSSTLLYSLINKGYDVHALTFNYGQKHKKEIESAREITTLLQISHKIIDLSSLGDLLSSAITSSTIEIPEVPVEVNHYDSLRTTVVPYRNAIFLSIATGYAQSIGANYVFYGAHYSDKGVYPDCRREFVESFENVAKIGTGNNELKIVAPFIGMVKSEIIEVGNQLKVPFEKTWSCYKGQENHCGVCSSCRERKIAFRDASITDPTKYTNSLNHLKITEIFYSIQGEGPNLGKQAIFLRTALCNLKCSWCDTRYTWDWDKYDYGEEVKESDIGTVEEEIVKYKSKHLVITGGEPLIQQRSLVPLLRSLKEKAFFVEVETNGTIVPTNDLVSLVDQWNVSPKLSNSNNPIEMREMVPCYSYFGSSRNSFFKFVVSSPNDLTEIECLVTKYNLQRDMVLLMPEASNSQQLIEHSKWLEPLAKDYGYQFTGRKHIELWGNARGR